MSILYFTNKQKQNGDMDSIEIYAGPIASSPSNSSDIVNSVNKISLNYKEFDFTTGVDFNNFIIAIPSTQQIQSIKNMETTEPLLSQFKLMPNITDINGSSYSIYKMTNAVSFSNNYTIKTILK